MAEAQEPPVTWSLPFNLSDSPVFSGDPTVVADQYGFVHVFWIEDVGGKPVEQLEATNRKGNSILYRCWDGEQWTDPIDIFFVRDGRPGQPTATVDNQGLIHLIWVELSGIHYSNAPSYAATSAQAWRSEKVIAPGRGFKPSLVVDKENVLHLAYTAWLPTDNESEDDNVYYTQSADSGGTWSLPVQVSDIPPGVASKADTPGLAVDGQGRIHLTWYTIDPPGWQGTAVFYARSDDGGQSWTILRLVDQVEEGEIWASKPKIAVRPPQEVHLVWVCGERAKRCHQWSTDGGGTWSPVQQEVFGHMHSLAYWDALAVDGSNTLYWAVQLRYPEAVYYSYWNGFRWLSPPQMITDDPLTRDIHGLELATRNGNELHLVAVNMPEQDTIWYFRGTMDGVDPAATQPTPIVTPTFTPTPPVKPVLTPTATTSRSQGAMDYNYGAPPSSTSSPINANHVPLAAGVASVLVMVVGIALVRTVRRW